MNKNGEIKLSPQEQRVASLAILGQGTKTIAKELGISPYTAQNYLNRMYLKLRVANRPMLVVWLLQHPGADEGEWVTPGLHPRGCTCGAKPCKVTVKTMAA